MASPLPAEAGSKARPASGPMAPRPFTVVERRRETDDTWTLALEPADGSAAPGFSPGQFNDCLIYSFKPFLFYYLHA